MAPSDKEIEATILAKVREVFKTDIDNLNVNSIRRRVESDLELEEEMLSSGKWKDKSKKLIKELAVTYPNPSLALARARVPPAVSEHVFLTSH